MVFELVWRIGFLMLPAWKVQSSNLFTKMKQLVLPTALSHSQIHLLPLCLFPLKLVHWLSVTVMPACTFYLSSYRSTDASLA